MNKFIGIGRLTKDPDIKYANNSKGENLCVGRYTIAIDRPGKDSGTDYISCIAFGKRGEFVEKYLRKGMKIAVMGSIQTGSYTNKDGIKVYTTDVVVDAHEFCEKKGSSEEVPEPTPEGDGFIDIPEGLEDDFPFK